MKKSEVIERLLTLADVLDNDRRAYEAEGMDASWCMSLSRALEDTARVMNAKQVSLTKGPGRLVAHLEEVLKWCAETEERSCEPETKHEWFEDRRAVSDAIDYLLDLPDPIRKPEMRTYQVEFTMVVHATVDIDALNEADANEVAWGMLYSDQLGCEFADNMLNRTEDYRIIKEVK